MRVHQATIEDLDEIAPLLDRYRHGYGEPSDPGGARTFLCERLRNHQSVIFCANRRSGKAAGFTLLSPSYSLIAMARTFILNDLFVVPEARRKGVASMLLGAAVTYARSVGAIRITLATAKGNDAAKSLYLSQGWKQDKAFHVFHLGL